MGKRAPEHENLLRVGNPIKAVEAERQYQQGRWGNRHDDGHTVWGWGFLLSLMAGKAAMAIVDDVGYGRGYLEAIRAAVIKLAATAVSFAEYLDRRIEREGL